MTLSCGCWHAGDKRFDQKELKSVLVSSGFGEEEAHDMCEGYFRIADDRGKINFEVCSMEGLRVTCLILRELVSIIYSYF